MTRFKLFAAAVLVSAAFTGPAFAQAAIQEPGLYSFYHPNGDALSGSRGAPGNAMAAASGSDFGGMRLYVRPHRAHHASVRKHY